MTKFSIVKWLWLVLTLALIGCAQKNFEAKVESEGHGLLSPSSFGGRLHAQQLMSVDYQEQQHRLRMILEINESQITLVGLSGFSVPVFNISWDGVNLSSRSKLPSDAQALSAERVMEDVMLALWPPITLDPLLEAKGWSMELVGENRYFTDASKRRVMSVEYQNYQQVKGIISVHYQDVDLGYKLETLQWDVTDE